MERKSFDGAQLDTEGTGKAIIGTFGQVDKDGDVLVRGVFGPVQHAQLIPSHQWQSVPLGRAVVREAGDVAVADLRFNMAIQAAKDWHSALRFDLEQGPSLQNWSWGF